MSNEEIYTGQSLEQLVMGKNFGTILGKTFEHFRELSGRQGKNLFFQPIIVINSIPSLFPMKRSIIDADMPKLLEAELSNRVEVTEMKREVEEENSLVITGKLLEQVKNHAKDDWKPGDLEYIGKSPDNEDIKFYLRASEESVNITAKSRSEIFKETLEVFTKIDNYWLESEDLSNYEKWAKRCVQWMDKQRSLQNDRRD